MEFTKQLNNATKLFSPLSCKFCVLIGKIVLFLCFVVLKFQPLGFYIFILTLILTKANILLVSTVSPFNFISSTTQAFLLDTLLLFHSLTNSHFLGAHTNRTMYSESIVCNIIFRSRHNPEHHMQPWRTCNPKVVCNGLIMHLFPLSIEI